MYRLTYVLVAFVLTAYTTIAAAYGIFSTLWWIGPHNYQIGIATNCAQTYNATVVDSSAAQFCTDFKWNAYASTQEKAMAALLFVAAIMGLVCLVMMIMNVWLECCCKFKAAPIVSVLLTLQFQCLLATTLIMAFYYRFSYPESTDSLGLAFILTIVAIPLVLASAFIIKKHRIKTVFREAEAHYNKSDG